MTSKTFRIETGGNGQATEAATQPAAGIVDAARSTIAGEFHKFVADVGDLVTSTTSLTGKELARAKNRLGARIDSARESVGQMGAAIAEGASKSVKATDSYVHQQPWQAIGIGAGVGLLVGFLLARRG